MKTYPECPRCRKKGKTSKLKKGKALLNRSHSGRYHVASDPTYTVPVLKCSECGYSRTV